MFVSPACTMAMPTRANREAGKYRRHNEGVSQMKVWIDQDLCTGDGLCEEIAPDVFTLLDDGLAYVKEGDKIFAAAKGNPQGAEGMASFPDSRIDAVVESAEECPGECIFIEP